MIKGIGGAVLALGIGVSPGAADDGRPMTLAPGEMDGVVAGLATSHTAALAAAFGDLATVATGDAAVAVSNSSDVALAVSLGLGVGVDLAKAGGAGATSATSAVTAVPGPTHGFGSAIQTHIANPISVTSFSRSLSVSVRIPPQPPYPYGP